MKNKIILLLYVFTMALNLLAGTLQLKQVDQWKYNRISLFHFFSLIDKDNQLLASFFKSPFLLLSKDKSIELIRQGEGPSEVLDAQAVFLFKEPGELAVLENPGKLKIFTKKNGTYIGGKILWLKRGNKAIYIKNGIFFDNKIFLTGLIIEKKSNTECEVNLLRILDENGNQLKQVIKRNVSLNYQTHLMRVYVVGYKQDGVFVLRENELKVAVVSSKTLNVVKEVNLEPPPFYKPMPKNFYIFKKYDNPKENFLEDIETWAMGYSKINYVLVSGKSLVLQIRTCKDKMKKFALLFYNAETFKLENTIFTDDLLLGAKDGKFYFAAGGDPGRDHENDELVINICTLEAGK